MGVCVQDSANDNLLGTPMSEKNASKQFCRPGDLAVNRLKQLLNVTSREKTGLTFLYSDL